MNIGRSDLHAEMTTPSAPEDGASAGAAAQSHIRHKTIVSAQVQDPDHRVSSSASPGSSLAEWDSVKFSNRSPMVIGSMLGTSTIARPCSGLIALAALGALGATPLLLAL